MGVFPYFTKADLVRPIIGLVLNLFFPGLGTMICACWSSTGFHAPSLIIGILQMLCIIVGSVGTWVGAFLSWMLVGVILMLLIVLIPLGWIWSLVWGILMIVKVGNMPTPQQAIVVTTTGPPTGQVPEAPVYYAPPVAAGPVAAPAVYYSAPIVETQPAFSEQQLPTSYQPTPSFIPSDAGLGSQANIPEGFFAAGQAPPPPSADPPSQFADQPPQQSNDQPPEFIDQPPQQSTDQPPQ